MKKILTKSEVQAILEKLLNTKHFARWTMFESCGNFCLEAGSHIYVPKLRFKMDYVCGKHMLMLDSHSDWSRFVAATPKNLDRAIDGLYEIVEKYEGYMDSPRGTR